MVVVSCSSRVVIAGGNNRGWSMPMTEPAASLVGCTIVCLCSPPSPSHLLVLWLLFNDGYVRLSYQQLPAITSRGRSSNHQLPRVHPEFIVTQPSEEYLALNTSIGRQNTISLSFEQYSLNFTKWSSVGDFFVGHPAKIQSEQRQSFNDHWQELFIALCVMVESRPVKNGEWKSQISRDNDESLLWL